MGQIVSEFARDLPRSYFESLGTTEFARPQFLHLGVEYYPERTSY